MMPHPERSLWPSLLPEALAHGGIQDGCGVFDSLAKTLASCSPASGLTQNTPC
jgi:phosphoribosylformylglycinamidine (FGAM) synthase-like amidotransferase family enzyme